MLSNGCAYSIPRFDFAAKMQITNRLTRSNGSVGYKIIICIAYEVFPLINFVAVVPKSKTFFIPDRITLQRRTKAYLQQ